MPLFLDQHETVDEETGEVVTCYAEHCGAILLSDQSPAGSKKPRTLVSKEDYWKAGWETDDDGDPVDPADVDGDEVKKFVIDPFKTTKQDLEEQFGKRYLFIIATWGEGAPEGKSGLMRGTGHSFFTGGDVLKKRGLVVEEKPKKKSAASAAANDSNETPPDENPDLEAAEARVTELEEMIEELKKAAQVPKPQESMASQFRDMAGAFGAIGGMSGANVNAQATAQREQFWQDQMTRLRQDQSDRERVIANEASAKSIAFETRLSTLQSEISAMRMVAVNEIAAVHQAQREDLNRREQTQREDSSRREIAHDTAIAAVKAQLSQREIQLSEFRQNTDTKISELSATLNGHKLLEMKAGIEKNFETEKLARIEKEHGEIKSERDHFKMLNAEQAETIEVMRRNLHTPQHMGESEGGGGFTIPRVVWKVLLPALPMIAMLLYKFFSDSGKPMPKEAADWFAKQARNADVPGADAWAQENYANAAEQERMRKEKEWDDTERERLRREEAERVERAARATEAAREERSKAEAEQAARTEAVANERREAEKQAAALVEKQAEATRVEAARVEAERVEAERVARIAEVERTADTERTRAGTPPADERTRVGTADNPIITPSPAEASSGGE